MITLKGEAKIKTKKKEAQFLSLPEVVFPCVCRTHTILGVRTFWLSGVIHRVERRNGLQPKVASNMLSIWW